ncbi:MAG: peptidylprolyl isomerase [Rhodocyclaceae bacterium]|nr:peptidylprolyl isomerase [Rhodocyclaceae bacterium]
MRPILPALAALVALALATPAVAADKPSAPHAATLAKVNGIAIPQTRFDEALATARARGASDSPELRANLKNQLIAQEVFRQEAVKRKLQNDPQVLAARDAAMIQRFLQLNVHPAPVAEDAVRSRFDAIITTLGPTEYRARIIAVADESKAREVTDALKAGSADFATLARQHSLLANAQRGGELDWTSFPLPPVEGQTQRLPLPFAQTLTGLKPGTVSGPVAYQGRIFLIQLEEARPTKVPNYNDVKATLRQALEAQALERATAQFVTGLISAAKIEQ